MYTFAEKGREYVMPEGAMGARGGDGAAHYHAHFDGLTGQAIEGHAYANPGHADDSGSLNRASARSWAGVVMAPPTPLQIAYIDPDGGSWNLSDRSMQSGYACSAIAGIEGLPVSMGTVPLLDGTAIANFYLPQPGTINLAVLIGWPASGLETDYYALLDSFVRAFLNRRNELPVPGYIAIQRPDGTSRQIAVYTTSGLNTPEVGIHNTLYTLTLNTPDPYWSDSVQQNLVYTP